MLLRHSAFVTLATALLFVSCKQRDFNKGENAAAKSTDDPRDVQGSSQLDAKKTMLLAKVNIDGEFICSFERGISSVKLLKGAPGVDAYWDPAKKKYVDRTDGPKSLELPQGAKFKSSGCVVTNDWNKGRGDGILKCGGATQETSDDRSQYHMFDVLLWSVTEGSATGNQKKHLSFRATLQINAASPNMGTSNVDGECRQFLE